MKIATLSMLIVCLGAMGCADIVQTRRMVDGKETILWTNRSNLERLEMEDRVKEAQADYYRTLPKRARGEVIYITLSQLTVDPQLRQSFHGDDFMRRLVQKFEQGGRYKVGTPYKDVDVSTHVELSKEVGLSRSGNLGEYFAITISGVVTNRYDPSQQYEVAISSDILHNVEAIDRYYQKINQIIIHEIGPFLPAQARYAVR